MMTLLTLMIVPATLIITFNHPLSMGLMLLIQTLLIAIITGSMNLSFWYSYILFIIMVGGMLVLFMYMTSVASNEKFKFSMTTLITMSLVIPAIMMQLLNDQWSFFSNFIDKETNSQLPILSLNKFLNMPSLILVIILILYLLVTLIAVIKIINIKHGPLRHQA